MKRVHLLSASALVAAVFASAFAQKDVQEFDAVDDVVRYAVLPSFAPVRIVYPAGEFFPTQSTDPYIYVGANFGYIIQQPAAAAGGVSLTYFAPTDLATNEYADDVLLAGGSTFLPLAHPNSTACLSEVTVGIYLAVPATSDITLRVRIYGWDGSVGGTPPPQYADPLNAPLDPNGNPVNLIWDSGVQTYAQSDFPSAGVYLLAVSVPNVVVSKALYIALTIGGIPQEGQVLQGGIVISHGMGNVYLLPSRGDFRRKTPAGRFLFTTAPQGSFFITLRGKHNFVGQINMPDLSSRAKPKDLDSQWLNADQPPNVDPPVEALRRNLIDVELENVNPQDGQTRFITRFTTYMDENGKFTIPVADDIGRISVRRWDNGLKVTFNRPAGGWSSSVCSPTEQNATMIFGDVNGDGVINNADLLRVLFGFGSSEQ